MRVVGRGPLRATSGPRDLALGFAWDFTIVGPRPCVGVLEQGRPRVLSDDAVYSQAALSL